MTDVYQDCVINHRMSSHCSYFILLIYGITFMFVNNYIWSYRVVIVVNNIATRRTNNNNNIRFGFILVDVYQTGNL